MAPARWHRRQPSREPRHPWPPLLHEVLKPRKPTPVWRLGLAWAKQCAAQQSPPADTLAHPAVALGGGGDGRARGGDALQGSAADGSKRCNLET